MHRRLYGAVAVEMIDVDRVIALERDVALHAPPDCDHSACGRHDPRVPRSRYAIDGHMGPVAPRDIRFARLPVHDQVELEVPLRSERKAIRCAPRIAPPGLRWLASLRRKQ